MRLPNWKRTLAASSFLLIPILCLAQEDWIDGKSSQSVEVLQYDATSQPSVAPNNTARTYYNSTDQSLMLSQNGSAYSPIITGNTSGNLSVGNLTVSGATVPVVLASYYNTTALTSTGWIKVIDNYVYQVGYPARFSILDVSNLSNIYVVGSVSSLNVMNESEGFDIIGSYAFTTSTKNHTINAISIANPANPTIVSSLTDTTKLKGAESLFIHGRYAYVNCRNAPGIAIVDITNPNQMTVVGNLTNSTLLNGNAFLQLDYPYLYTTSTANDYFTVINVSNASAPTIAGSITNTSLDYPAGVYVERGYAFVSSFTNDSVSIWNISNLSSISKVSSIRNTTTLNGAFVIKKSGDYLYVSCLDGNAFTTIDVSNYANPVIVSSLVNATALNAADDIYLSNNRAYVTANTGARLTILSLPSIRTPSITTGSLTSNDIEASEMDVRGSSRLHGGLAVGGPGISTQGSISAYGSVAVTNTSGLYIGNPTVNGTWRIIASANNLSIDRRENGTWVRKTAFTP